MTTAERANLARLHDVSRKVSPTSPSSAQNRAVVAATTFHRAIQAGSRNEFIVRFLDTLAPFDRTVQRHAVLNAEEWPQDQQEHEAVMAAIELGDDGKAEQVMREHVLRVLRFADG
jgi:DNA-binding GntR family transcriptional regulator